jgi:predicted small secreted protein
MKNKKWQKYISLGIALIAAILIGNFIYKNWKIKEHKKIKIAKENKEAARKNKQLNILIDKMAKIYHANIDWGDKFQNNQRIPFSIELKNAMTAENKPISIRVDR